MIGVITVPNRVVSTVHGYSQEAFFMTLFFLKIGAQLKLAAE